MARENLNDIVAFLAVAREKNFTRAAAKLGVSQSALSHTIRALETRLGLKLLTRTTRSVAPTDAGERLLTAVGPHFEDIQAELDALGALRDTPRGTVRITAGLHATETILWPKLQPLLRKYPELKLEITVDYGLAASGRTSASSSWQRRPTSRITRNPAFPPTSPSTTASTCGCPPTAACIRGSSNAVAASSTSAWMGN
jgi:hypothetical protein